MGMTSTRSAYGAAIGTEKADGAAALLESQGGRLEGAQPHIEGDGVAAAGTEVEPLVQPGEDMIEPYRAKGVRRGQGVGDPTAHGAATDSGGNGGDRGGSW